MCQILWRSVSGSASRRSGSSQQPRRRVQAARSAAMFAAMTHPALAATFWREVPQAHGLGGADAAGLDDGMLAVDGVDVLGVVAAGDAGDPGAGDVLQVMEYFQPVFFS
jgi:hypothetical protein